MIAALSGRILEKNLNDAVIDVEGVGYRVFLSLLSMARIPEEGQSVRLRIRTVIREDAFELFGFLSRQEEEMFLLLTSVSHVGPKLAINVLSGLEVEDLAQAIGGSDIARLTRIHGVGKKTAERLVLELKDKVKSVRPGAKDAPSAKGEGPLSDLISALVNLGYKPAQAQKAAEIAEQRAGPGSGFEVLFRESLKSLRG